jgi:hypothetical protein
LSTSAQREEKLIWWRKAQISRDIDTDILCDKVVSYSFNSAHLNIHCMSFALVIFCLYLQFPGLNFNLLIRQHRKYSERDIFWMNEQWEIFFLLPEHGTRVDFSLYNMTKKGPTKERKKINLHYNEFSRSFGSI